MATVVLSKSNYCTLIANFTLGSLDTNNPFGTKAQLGINFSNARISYSNLQMKQNRFPRGSAPGSFPAVLATNYSNIINVSNYDINCNVTAILSNLLPDILYSFNVEVNTNINNNYGIRSSNSQFFRTLLPPYPPRLSDVSQCNDGMFYIRNGFTIDSRNNILNILCNSVITQRGGLCNVINNRGSIAILTDTTPGHNFNNDFANITVICGTTDVNRFQLVGWQTPLLAGSSNQSNSLGNSIIRVGSQQQDPYAGNSQLSNFYLQASNITVIITPTFLTGSHLPYSYSITHSNDSYSNITISCNNIYVDNLTQLASVTSLCNNPTNPTVYEGQYISGLFSLSNTQTFNFDLNLANFASNFLPACNILVTAELSVTPLVGSSYTTATITLLSNTTIYNQADQIIASGTAPTQCRLKLANLVFTPAADTIFLTTNTATQISANLTIENLVGTATITHRVPYYFDTLSLSNLSINHSDSKAIGGARYISFSNSFCNAFIEYDQSQKIYANSACNIYNNELPLVEGSYRTGGNIGGRFDSLGSFVLPSDGSIYPANYVNLKSENQVRYATFKYSLSNSSGNQINTLEFNMNTQSMFSYIDTINCNFNSDQVPTLFYKIDKVGGNSGSLINTGWLNGNSSLLNAAPLNSNNAKDGSNGLLKSSGNYTITNIKRYWNIIPIPTNTSYDVYIKIGLQSACNLYFDYMYLQSRYFDLGVFYSPSNAIFEVITAPTTVKISWSNTYQDTYTITETRITGYYSNNATYPRRVVVGSRYTDDPINASVAGVIGIAEYDKTLLNADTYYNIFLSNISDSGKVSDTTLPLTGKTDLPPYGEYTNFYDGSMKFKFFKEDGISTDIYFPNSVIYYSTGNVPRNSVTDIIRNQKLSIKLVKNTGDTYAPFIINYSRPGPELSDFILYANINGSISSYQFSNGQYTNNITNYSNTEVNNIQIVFNNAGDMTTNSRDIGFFYKSALQAVTLNALRNGSNNITLSNNFGNNYSQNFLVDTGTIAPTINNMFVDSNGLANSAYYTYVSGVLVFRTITACNYNFWMQTSNLNTNFIVGTPITFQLNNNSGIQSELTVNGVNIPIYSAANTGSEVTNSFVNATNNTFFRWPNVSLSGLTNIGPENLLNLVGKAFNLSGESAIVTQQLAIESGNRLYFDSASLQTIALTTSTNFINKTTNVLCNWGYKVTSGAGLFPGVLPAAETFGTEYNHTNTLLSGSTYANELQLVNGYFTSSNLESYINYNIYYNPISDSYTYPNYTNITYSGDIRWATFMWRVTGINTFGSVLFNNHNLISSGTSFKRFNNCLFYYKIVGANLNATSGWLNGNIEHTGSKPSGISMSNNNKSGGLGTTNSLLSGKPQPTANMRYILLQSTTGGTINIGNTQPYSLYIRFGLSNTIPKQYFQSIQLAALGDPPSMPY